ncbi:MAG: methyltransferase domain-containing protein [Methylobacteriaceae bacterium]|nr:methyltransferase domain-containing protein [Methylobacteriaceae bacterium]
MDGPAPRLFDRALVRRRLARAHGGRGFADFLLARAAEDLGLRLSTVARRFPLAADLGTPTGAAADALQASGQVERVVRLAPVAGGARPDAVADLEAVPLAPASLDLATSLLALQAANDLPGALLQIRQALRPDGLFLGCLLAGDSLRELRDAFAAAESEREGGASPRVAPFAEIRSLGTLLQRAGFALPVADLEPVTVRYANPLGLLADLRAMGFANPLAERRRTFLQRGTLMRMAAIYAERYADPDGRVRATFELAWLSGWAPHESQPKPLKPGSATVRLADALGRREAP